MACPIHIWLPAMAGLAPVGRVARDRLRSLRANRAARAAAAVPAREIRRWAPVQPPTTSERTARTSD